MITLDNQKIFYVTSHIRFVLGYIWGADSKNDIGFFCTSFSFQEMVFFPMIWLEQLLCFCLSLMETNSKAKFQSKLSYKSENYIFTTINSLFYEICHQNFLVNDILEGF